jgi:hypothetical protein
VTKKRPPKKPAGRVWTDEEQIQNLMDAGGYPRDMAEAAFRHFKLGGGEYIDADGYVCRP